MECRFDLYDDEVFEIERALRKINEHKDRLSFAEFEEMVVYEMAAVNIKAAVMWEVGGLEAVPTEMLEFTIKVMINATIPSPQITLVERLPGSKHYSATGDFDHERQAHNVQHDILGIDQPGAIGKGGIILSPSKSTSFISTKKD